MRVEKDPKAIARLLFMAVAVAAVVAAVSSAGPVAAQGSGLDQYCSLAGAQVDPAGNCDEAEVIILPLPEPIDEVPDQTILPVDIPDGGVVNVEVSGIVSLVDGGSAIAVQPEAIDFVDEQAVAQEAVAPQSDVVADTAATSEPLPVTGGTNVWLIVLATSGTLAVLFGVLLFRRASSGL